jgi:hypothetical protein
LVWTQGTARFYSRRGDRLTCVARAQDTDWLGTRLGVKRVDRTRGTVRHYTQADGLPGDRVLSIGLDGGDVWCAVAGDALSEGALYVCRLPKGRDVWQAERVLSWPYRWLRDAAFAVSERSVAVVARASDPALPPLVLVGEKRGVARWRVLYRPAAYRDPSDLYRENPLLYAEAGDRFWVGTNQGLVRCDARTGETRTFLPGRAVRAGVPGGGGVGKPTALWLLLSGEGATAAKDSVARFDPTSGAVIETFPLPDRRDVVGEPLFDPPRFGRLVWADAALWLLNDMATFPFGNNENVYRLDTATKRWRRYEASRPDDVGLLPDAVLVAQLPVWDAFPVPPNGPLGGALARRFPAWFCPAESLPDGVTKPGGVNTSMVQYGDARLGSRGPGPEHTLRTSRVHVPAGRPATASQITGREVLPFPGLRVPRKPAMQAVAAMSDGTLVAVERGRLWRRPPGAMTWEGGVSLPLPVEVADSAGVSLIPDGGALWISTEYGRVVVRCDPRTGGGRVAYRSRGVEPVTVLGVLSDGRPRRA